ncbi:hypothetical protein [Vibrio gigantis]|uniref:hypothetical protein n=1 Tax=Vibrio gigantis TaxID=296199 RepID=UPI001BFDE99F|nr:hypothetical protein [Vibrio gigantis]
MSNMDSLLQQAVDASLQQTAASKEMSDEVRGKMGDIDKKVADAEKEFNDFISGDFDINVNQAKGIEVFIDPIDGDDSNSGTSSVDSIKTSLRLNELANLNYDYVRLIVRKGTEFSLEHVINAKREILVEGWAANDGNTNKPIIKQGLVNYSGLIAPDVMISSCQIYTYEANENESLPDVWSTRSFFGSQSRLHLIFSNIEIYDNQLLHIHNGGSGDTYHRRSISLFSCQIKAKPSAQGVVGSHKKVFTFVGGSMAFPLDLFGTQFTVELNGQYATFRELLNMPETYMATNINLDLS